MTGDGRLVEVQATAERVPFGRDAARRAARARRRRGSRRIARRAAGCGRCSSRLSPVADLARGARAASSSPPALGGAIGLERELRRAGGRPPHAHARLGRLGALHARRAPTASTTSSARRRRPSDPTRIAAQIVTGIGFLGAGVIIRQGFTVRGLTTAASSGSSPRSGWPPAPATGLGAVIATVVALVSLRPLRIVACQVLHRAAAASRRLLVELRAGESPAPLIERARGARRRACEALAIGARARPADGRRSTSKLPPGADARASSRRSAELEVVQEVALERLSARALLAERAQAARAAGGAAGLDDRAARRGRLPAGDGGDSTTRTRAARRVYGREVGPADAWMLGEDSGHRGRRARRRARRPLGALGRGRPAIERAARASSAASRRPRARATSASSSRSRRTAREVDAARACSTGGSRTSRAASEGFGYDPVFVPDGEDADGGRARRRLEARELAPRAGAALALGEPGCARRRWRSRVAPVDLGAEDDHVRHHVEPDEQERRAAERLQRERRCFE